MALVRPETPLVIGSVAVLEVAFAFELIGPEFTDIVRVSLGEFKFTDAAPNTVLPFTLVEVSVWPLINANTIWLVIVVKAKVYTLVWVDVAPQPCLFVSLPEPFILRAR